MCLCSLSWTPRVSLTYDEITEEVINHSHTLLNHPVYEVTNGQTRPVMTDGHRVAE